MKKKVSLTISSSQYIEKLEPSGEAFDRKLELEDSTQFFTEGVMYFKNDAWYITYEESAKMGMAEGTAVLKLYQADPASELKTLEIRRFCKDELDASDMTFREGLNSITRYKIPEIGSLDIETYTMSLNANIDEDGGKIFVEYRLSFEQEFSRRTKLEIEVKPSLEIRESEDEQDRF